MDTLNFLYKAAINIFGPPVALFMSLKGRFGGRWDERLGFVAAPAPGPDCERILFHAASVGEAKSAIEVIRALLRLAEEKGRRPEIYLSVGTPAGIEAAEKALINERRVWVLAAPVDFWGAPRRCLDALAPRALVIMETELWPNFIACAHKRGLKLVLAAARLSDRSFSRYKKLGGFMKKLLSRFDLIAAMGERERGLYAALGAPLERLIISGNPKFDHLILDAASENFAAKTAAWREKIRGPEPGGPLIVAGSTHPGEEEAIVKAYESLLAPYPAAKLLLAPRHLGRVHELLGLLRGRGAPVFLTGEAVPQNGPAVYVADEMGHLLSFYAVSDVAIIGGSLLFGLTGHNPLEAAAVMRPMLFGPFMESFAREAEGLISTGGAKETTVASLAADLEILLGDPALARQQARAAHNYLAGRGPVAPALAEAILKLLTC